MWQQIMCVYVYIYLFIYLYLYIISKSVYPECMIVLTYKNKSL